MINSHALCQLSYGGKITSTHQKDLSLSDKAKWNYKQSLPKRLSKKTNGCFATHSKLENL